MRHCIERLPFLVGRYIRKNLREPEGDSQEFTEHSVDCMIQGLSLVIVDFADVQTQDSIIDFRSIKIFSTARTGQKVSFAFKIDGIHLRSFVLLFHDKSPLD